MIVKPGAGAAVHVCAHLSPQTLAEAEAAGIPVPEIWPRLFSVLAQRRSTVHSFYLDDRPMAVFAVREVHNGGDTFLIGADDFFEQSIRHRRVLRDHLAGLFHWFGPIHTTTWSPHPNMARWLAMLGYERLPTSENLYRWG